MNIADIRVFLEINRSQNISAAARAMYMTQTTLSRRLSLLEKDLQVQLFLRGRGFDTVTLTPAGERFLVLAEQMVTLEEEAYALQETGSVRRLSLAVPDSIASYSLREFFFELSRQSPRWDLEIVLNDSLQICEMIDTRVMDAGLTNEEAPFPDLKSILLFQERYVVLRRGTPVSPDHMVHPSELNTNHEIQQIICPEHQFWHNQWWIPGTAKLRVNHARFTAGFLNDPEDWAVLPESVAR